ncbi:MAG TPA: L-2-amino-thiazoline-4-carboxylic acid hydrolase [Polyangium sp.]|nr:L-2-amino-thiazoline-4-carboxylic acid hydrolase [Polyangium sp.]
MDSREFLEVTLRYGADSARRTLTETPASRLDGLVWARYDKLASTAPQFENRTNRGLFIAAVPVVALYKVLREEFSLDQDAALHLADTMMRDAYAVRLGFFMKAALNTMYRFPPMRRLMMAQMTKTDEPDGFRFEKRDEPETLMAFDVHVCPIVNFAKKHDAPEIVPLICRLDDLLAEQLVGIELRRTGTIGMGAERCDFRYVRSKK